MEVFFGIFRGNSVAEYFHHLVAETVLATICMAPRPSPAARLAILEIGAGIGSTATVVLEKIQHLASRLSFYYTDISSSLTRYGEKTFAARFPWVQFALLNIEEDPLAQGFPPASFDIVYASTSTVFAELTRSNLLYMSTFCGLGINQCVSEGACPWKQDTPFAKPNCLRNVRSHPSSSNRSCHVWPLL
jgi:hypothetical protein